MTETMNRRKFLMGLAAGGVVVAGELWVPGAKVISIPKPSIYMPLADGDWIIDSALREIRSVGGPKVASIGEFYGWLSNAFDKAELTEDAAPMLPITETVMEMQDGWRIEEQAFHRLRGGAVIQGDEIWSDWTTVGDFGAKS